MDSLASFFETAISLFRSLDGQVVLNLGMLLSSLMLVIFTWILAKETRVLARAASRSEVVVTLQPNIWNLRHFDVVVMNSGNTAVYEVKINFDPPIMTGFTGEKPTSLRKVSIMRPGQIIESSLANYAALKGKTIEVDVSWKSSANAKKRSAVSYVYDIADFEDFARINHRPDVELAQEMKKFRERWDRLATGLRRLEVDVYTEADRIREMEEKRAWYSQQYPGDGNDSERA